MARALGLAVVLSMCAFLLGLSHAPDALPGDMFQFVRSAPSHAVTVVDLSSAKKMGSPDGKASSHYVSALPVEAALDDLWPAGAVAAIGLTIHSGRGAGTPGCRSPPTS